MKVGYLYKGYFYCTKCVEFAGPPSALMPVSVYEINIKPYSQVCSWCRELIVDGLKRSMDNGPLCLFNVSPLFFDVDFFAKKSYELGHDAEAQSCNDRDMVKAFLQAFLNSEIKDAKETASKILSVLNNGHERYY